MNSEKGVSLIITFFIMIIVLAVVLSISIILYNEIKVIRNIGDSVVAFYIADSGVEKTLFYDRKVVPDDATGNKRGACNICASCPDCTCTSQPSGSACKPASCENCTITFNSSLAGNKTYSVIAKVFPSVNDNTFSAISIDSIGSYNHAIGVDAVKRAIELNVVKQETGQPIPPLTVIATSPGSAPINQPVTFFAIASPPDIGNYSYDWSGACTGTGSSCTASFSAPKVYSATVLVTDLEDSSRTASAVASVTITPPAPWTICGDNLTDSRDNKTYGTVKIGNQCWMAQNLNVGTKKLISSGNQGLSCNSIQKYCYDDLDVNCNTYGGLYQWNQAMCNNNGQDICPAGWHIPTHSEFTTLERKVCTFSGNSDITCAADFPDTGTGWFGTAFEEVATELKTVGSTHFSALLGGYFNGAFSDAGNYAGFWSSTEKISTTAWDRDLDSNPAHFGVDQWTPQKTNGLSVRCLKDVSSAKAITAFSFNGLSPAVVGTIDENNHAIALTVPYGTNVRALVASFTTTGSSIKIGATVQISGTTPNDFTNPATYAVTAEDNSTQNYIVTVTVIPLLNVSAIASPSSGFTGDLIIFTAYATGGSGNYIYNWTGDCTGTGSNCTATFSTAQSYTAMLTVTSGGQTVHASAGVTISNPVVWACGQTLTDTRDSKTYPTILIGNQCWMAQNLNVGARVAGSVSQGTSCSSIQKYCYNDSDTGCSGTGKYGGLYQWSQAMCGSAIAGTQGICPAGWHIPTHDEFTTLERVVCASLGTSAGTCANYFPYNTTTIGGRGANEGTALKDGGSSGFNGVYAGGHSSIFFNVGLNGYFWSSLQDSNTSDAWVRYLYTGSSTVFRDNSKSKTNGFSVRCVKN